MPDIALPSFPLPLFTAALLFWLCLVGIWRRAHAPVTLAILALCGGQALLTALGLFYGIGWARQLMPVSAAAIPAMVWMAFVVTARRDAVMADLVHLLGPAFAVFCRFTVPAALDSVIPFLFAGYGLALLSLLRQGGDSLPRLSLGHGDVPGRLWQALALALIASALSDVLIVLAQGVGRVDLVGWIVSLGSSLTLAIVGTLALTPALQASDPDGPALVDIDVQAADAEVMAGLSAMMAHETLYLDPDLSLNRLSRRLRVPAKRVSEAINRQTGGNVSRFINAYRIDAACARLAQGDSVTEAMLASGFNTKSNFNREFLRVIGQSPSAWREKGLLRLPQAVPTS